MNEIDTSKVTRVEVIDENGRGYVKYGVTDVEFSLQDDSRTLKLFLKVENKMKKYCILQTIMLSFLTSNDSYDTLLGPENGYLKFDGKDIIFVTHTGKELAAHTTNNAIDLWLEQGKIEEIKC